MSRFELSDEQFRRIEPMRSGRKEDRGVTGADNRLFADAVLWVLRTGSPWRDLPERFGKWSTVYTRYNRWCKKGVWQDIMAALAAEADAGAIAIDSTVIRAHRHAAGAPKKAGSPTPPGSRGRAGRGAASAPRYTRPSTPRGTRCGSP